MNRLSSGRKSGFYAIFALLFFSAVAFVNAEKKKIKLWLIGDSTMAAKQVKFYPETGWGMPFACFFDSSVVVDNRAQNGRSTKSFMTEGRWIAVMNEMNADDWVLIQFGHNDEIPTKKNATTETEFKTNLIKYVTDTRSKNANPVLITPVARRKFDADGTLEDTHKVYAEIVRRVAAETKTPLIDLDKLSQQELQRAGVETSKLYFLHLAAGEHPNYPDGKTDDTHFSELGARKMAQIVYAGIRDQKIGLASKLVRPKKK